MKIESLNLEIVAGKGRYGSLITLLSEVKDDLEKSINLVEVSKRTEMQTFLNQFSDLIEGKFENNEEYIIEIDDPLGLRFKIGNIFLYIFKI